MKLSEHLTLAEIIRSESAKRLGISNQPTSEHLDNMKILAENIFEPIRRHFDSPIYVSSGYRSEALNKAIKGSKTSQHCKGQAMDIDMDGSDITNNDVFYYIKNNLNFQQLIAEFPVDGKLSWVHVGYDKNNLKNEILIAKKVKGRTIYIPYKGNESLVK
jgi:zinc D-Ala-D-Ala carboxypeptidase